MGPPQYPFPALRQLFRAEEDVDRLQRQLDELRMEVDRTVKNLQHAQILATDARERLAAMGAVKIDGIWKFPEDTDGER
jgi:branched-subunit amino acid aminotransferase/4-amino-4-deoxychorismate lyase